MKKIVDFLKRHKNFIIFIYKNIRGVARLRALYALFSYLTVIVAGWGITFYFHSTNNWGIEVSYSTIGWFELSFGILGILAFYIWLYFDNKAVFNKSIASLSNKMDDISEEILQVRRSQEVAAILPFYSFEQFESSYNKHNVADLEDTEELRAKRHIITNENEKNVRILALSGTGKTFLILKAFREQGNIENIFYCDTVRDSRFKDAVNYIAEHKPGSTIILDNCPSKISNMVIEETGNKLRIISAYFDPNDRDYYSCLINLVDCGIPSIIERIISNNSEREMPAAQKEFIKYHSGDIPLMALLLTQAFNKNGVYSNIHDNHLMENLLDIDGENKEEQRIAMRTIALFQPFDFDNAKSSYAKYIIENDYFTPIVSQVKRNLLFVKVVDKLHKRNLIEKDSIFINMRPQPLACWLVGEWLQDQGSFIMELISDITQQPKSLYNPILEAFAKRLEFMQGNHDAEALYEELLKVHDGPFCNEDVIYSEFGSRLILAMSTVNPIAVVNCLFTVLFEKSIDSLKDNLKDDARRNVVRTLEKLCFCNDSFEKAALLMARLAIAENEGWANNARGQFLQLFHVALAGTESDFNARMNVLQKLHLGGDEYKPLLLDAIRGAFNHSNLVRTRGAEKFGFIEKLDFHPTWNQIYEYWNNLYIFLTEWVEKEPEITKEIADIVCYNTRMFIRSKRPELLFQFIEYLAPKLNYRWNEMHKALVETKNYDKVTAKTSEKILLWLEKLTPQDIIGRMKETLHDMFTKNDYDSDLFKQEENVVIPFVEEFIEKKTYLTEEIFQLIDPNDEYISWAFNANFAKLLPPEHIPIFCNYIEKYIFQKEKNFYSSFLVSVFGKLNEKHLVWPFAQQLFNTGYINLSISIFAVIDDSDRKSLSFVMQKASEGIILHTDVRRYLSAIRMNNATDVLYMAVKLKDLGADASLIFDHISHYWYLDECYYNKGLVNLYQDAILNYPLKNNDSFNNEFTRSVKNLLRKNFDAEFVKSLNKKLIEFLSNNKSLFQIEEIYEVLLTDKYREIIWEEFSEAFTDIDNRGGFFFNVRYAVGSGFGFGEKSLFFGHIDQMKQLCRNFKHGAFVCAATCPVFDIDNATTGKVNTFHPFVIWLIKNYGNQQSILDELHANLNTFSWTGSSIPLMEDCKRCFNNLKLNKELSANVYDWIDLCLQSYSAEYKREEQSEAYIRLAYGKD